jgi:hypothetical protein
MFSRISKIFGPYTHEEIACILVKGKKLLFRWPQKWKGRRKWKFDLFENFLREYTNGNRSKKFQICYKIAEQEKTFRNHIRYLVELWIASLAMHQREYPIMVLL